MKASFKQTGTRAVVFALLLGLIAVGTWQTVSAKENQGQNLLNSIFGSISNLITFQNTESPTVAANSIPENLVIGVCDTAGPIEVESTGGTTSPTAYATLKDAFDAVNAGTHTGSINIEVCGNTTETATASLNASGTGSASFTDITVRPVGGARIIEGTITGAIVKLTGADNVLIDGRQGGTGSARDLTVRNNSTASATAAIWLTSTGVGAGATNNTIRNLEIACGVTQNTSTNTTIGILMASNNTAISVSSGGDDNDNNSFIANRIIKSRYGIVTRGQTTNNNQNPVVIDNLIGTTSFGADQIGKVGILMQADNGGLVSRNTVQFVGGDFANTTGGADRIGIGIGSESWSASAPGTIMSGNYTVTRNIIHDIVEQRTFSSAGILASTTGGGSPTDNLIANNFIYNIVANGTSGDQPVGIGIAGGHSDNIVFNSIAITGDMDGTGASNAATYGNAIRVANASSSAHANLNLKNNSIYMDVNSNTSTLPYFAITVNSATYDFGTGGLDNNNYYINQANSQMNTGGISTSGTAPTAGLTFKTLANWQGALTPAQDQNSIQADPQYVSNTADLHIAMASPNVNAGVAAGGVFDDIDGQLRNGVPDIGADEPAGLTPPMNDIATTSIDNPPNGGTVGTGMMFTPQATFTNLGTNPQTNVTVRFRILDASMTVIYNQTANIASISSGASASVSFPATSVASVGTYTTIASAELAGDENTANDSVMGSFMAVTPLSGSVNVGMGQTFTSLTNPGGVFEYLNNAGATSNVQINITSDLTSETGTVALEEVGGGFSVTIKPSGASRTISGDNGSFALIRINGADNVTIDGSLPAPPVANVVGGNASIRNLTIQNTSAAATAAAVVAVTEGSNGANNVTIKNVNVMGQDPSQTLLGIHVGGNTIGVSPTTANNNNSHIENCSFQKAILGIFNNGITGTPATGTVITQNDLSATGANRLRRAGIFFFNQDGIQVMENSIGGIDTTEGADAIGIIAGNQNVTTTTAVSGGIINANISRNKINGIANNGIVGFSAAGIVIAGGPGGPNTIANNMITGVSAASTSPDLVAGIFVTSAAGSETKVFYNSVAMTGDRMVAGGSTAQLPSYGLAYTANVALELKNNIFYTTQVSTGGGANAKSYAIGTLATTFTNLDSNFNDFWSTGANDGGFRSGSLTGGAGTDYPDLMAWQTATSQDANSQEVDPLFVDPLTDLHLQAMTPVENDGTPIAGITNDFDGNPRSMTTPEIGADELFAAVPGTLAFSSGTYSGGEGSGTISLTVNRTVGSEGAVTVDYSLANGTANGGASCGTGVDFVNTGGTLMFASGETSKMINVPICEDMELEGDETFTSTLSNATGGATIGMPSSTTVTITDNDTPANGSLQFSAATYSVGEGDGMATITVTRTGGSEGAVSADYATSNGTATGGGSCGGSVDYVSTSGTVMFANGDTTSKTFNVPICDDMNTESDETVNLTLSNATGGATIGTPSAAVLTIMDNDGAAGPVTVTATAGTASGTYNTLTEAVAAVNAGTHQGDIVVNINQSITEPGSVVINSSGAGSASYTSILIRPTSDTITVSGASIQGRGLIELNGADNVTIDGDNPNTAGFNRNLTLQNTASSATTFTSVVRIALATSVVNSADNNTIKNLNILGSATGRNISGATSTTASENTTFGIFAGPGGSTSSGTTAPSAVTSVSTGVGAGATASNLLVSNNSFGTAARGVSINGSATSVFPGLQINQNTIGNPTAGDVDQVYSIGITAQGSLDALIAENTVWIEGYIPSSSSNQGINVGVNSTAITGATIERNKVNRVQNNNGNTWTAFGINLGGGSSHIVRNNFVSGVINNQTTGTGAFGTLFGAIGIRIGSGTGHTIYHNSVNLYGMMPGTTSSNLTAAFMITSTTLTGIDVRNNIFSNQITGGNPDGTRHAVVYLPSGATSAMNLTWNNNAYYQGGDPLSRLAQVGGTFSSSVGYFASDFDPTQTTPATNFRAYTSTLSAAGTNDNASFASSAPPPFTSNVDLHIPNGTATRLESGGAAVGVTNDIDLEMRNATTPDIGADEFAGQPPLANDIAALTLVDPRNGDVVPVGAMFSPQATFSNIGTVTQTNVTVRYQIVDASMAVIYNETANISTIAPLQVVTVTFPATSLPSPGTYTIKASAELAGDENTSNDMITGSITAVLPIGGPVTVGTGGDYTSLTNPGGLFEALNIAGISGNLTVNIITDLTAETGAVPLNQLSEVGAGGYTVTIKPSGAPRTISGTASSLSMIKLNGADRITIDGSLSGGTDRSLSLLYTNTGGVVVWIASAGAGNGANDNTIKNCIIAANPGTLSVVGVVAGSGTTLGGAAEAQNNNNSLLNNHIFRVQNSYYNQGNLAGLDQNWTISNNEFGSTVPADKNQFRGMLIGNAQNFVVSNNTVRGVTIASTTTGNNASGIQLAFTLNGGSIVNNKISDIRQTGTQGAYGIFSSSTTANANVLIANNFIWDVAAVGSATTTLNGHGINFTGTGAGGYKIYHNSVNMNATQGSGTTSALQISGVSATGVLDVRNNIFANTAGAGATRFAVHSTAPASVFSMIDNNDYFAQNVGFIGGSTRTTLTEWQAATGQDVNSKAVDPLFVSSSDLHIQAGSPMVDMGANGTGVMTDFDGDLRDAMPDIGADEIVQGPNPGTIQFSSATYSGNEGDGQFVVTVTRTGGSLGTVTVDYSTSNGTATGGASCTTGIDYVSTSGTLTFMDGETSKTFNVTVCDDMTVEPNETINYTLSNPTGGATLGTPSTAVQTIVDNDAPLTQYALAINDVKVVEGDSGTVNAVFTVTLTETSPGGGNASVQYSTSNGTAVAGSDYSAVSGTLNFSGAGMMTITVPVIGDTVKESNEFFFVNLSNPSMNTSITDGQGVGIIVDRDRAYRADYDRDFKADFSVYRPSNSTFYVSKSSKGFPIFQTMGASGDIPVPGDYDGDGKTDFALFRPSTGDWTILRSSDDTTLVVNWGLGTDKPVQGDYDGDGKTDFAVFRPSEGNWYILPTASGLFYTINFGISTDRLVQADYDGDFKTDVAVYRDGTWYALRSSDGSVLIQNWGLASDVPAVGDFDGDGRNDLTVFRNGDWYIFRSLTNDFFGLKWGLVGDIPVVADYDGDGTSDVAVFRPSGGDWYVLYSSGITPIGFHWGQNGDVPIPSKYLPQ